MDGVKSCAARGEGIRLPLASFESGLGLIAPLHPVPKIVTPVFDTDALRTESDVEQKLIYPFLTHLSFVGLPPTLVRTKEYMSPTDIDKAAGKRYGYVPDYSIWLRGLPLVVAEAKAPDIAIEAALREAFLYAGEINKRYPPGVNPIGFVLASNGVQFALSESDSETNALIFNAADARPGSAVLDAVKANIGRVALEERANRLSAHFQSREFSNASAFMGGEAKLGTQLGVNEFAQPLFQVLTKYFASNSDETPDDVIDRAYVTSDELTRYEGLLETFLKDRTPSLAGNQLQPITTTRDNATGLSTELTKFAGNPKYYSRVQLLIGSVGAGKTTFIKRYYRRLMSNDVRQKTRWAFLNFNVVPPDPGKLQTWIAESFLESFGDMNRIDLHENGQLEKVFGVELKQYERGPNKALKTADPAEYARKRTRLMEDLVKDKTKFTECVTRHFSGERGLGIVIVFDNVDKRSREEQLKIFEAAQWFKNLTKALVLVNLRDTTFETHKDEPPLDAFTNAINFYVRPPRFAQVIRKRLELLLESLPEEVEPLLEYTLPSGYKIKYPSSRLGEFLLAIYLSLFHGTTMQVGAALEALVAKDVRRALGMFGDIIVSPHLPTDQITKAALGGPQVRIQEYRIIRALMRGRYQYYNGRSNYIRNVLSADPEHIRPSNFLNADILEFLIRNRKAKIDLRQEGYATIGTLLKKMSQVGYEEADTFSAVRALIRWGLIEPESLTAEHLNNEDAVTVHASGFIHMRYFATRSEYLIGVTPQLNFASRAAAQDIGGTWASQDHFPDLTSSSKRKILEKLSEYFTFEYKRRCGRHAFYEELGWGGKALVSSIQKSLEHFDAYGRLLRSGQRRL